MRKNMPIPKFSEINVLRETKVYNHNKVFLDFSQMEGLFRASQFNNNWFIPLYWLSQILIIYVKHGWGVTDQTKPNPHELLAASLLWEDSLYFCNDRGDHQNLSNTSENYGHQDCQYYNHWVIKRKRYEKWTSKEEGG